MNEHQNDLPLLTLIKLNFVFFSMNHQLLNEVTNHKHLGIIFHDKSTWVLLRQRLEALLILCEN